MLAICEEGMVIQQFIFDWRDYIDLSHRSASSPLSIHDYENEFRRFPRLGRKNEERHISWANDFARIEEWVSEHITRFDMKVDIAMISEGMVIPVDNLMLRLDRGRNATDVFLKSELKLVSSMAKKYSGGVLSDEELIDAGFGGLRRALQRYDLDRESTYPAYARWWIWSRIGKAIDAKTANNNKVV
jgi:DNA-directed RNA polymerase sigma subunit (sigma70/sigma32)